MNVRRRAAAALAGCAIAAGVVATAPAAASASPKTGCQAGFSDPGEQTFTETLALPRIQTGLNDGSYTVSDLEGLFAIVDANGDGNICLKAVSNLQGNSTKAHSAFYLAVDNFPRH